MTPEQQRIAIAEFCGWKFHPLTEHLYTDDEKAVAIMCWVRPGNDSWHIECVPDYLNDLNAMHEAEKRLLPDDAYYSQQNFYASELGRITGNDNGRGWKPLSNDACFNILHATAAQRAEALLKTIGKWEEMK